MQEKKYGKAAGRLLRKGRVLLTLLLIAGLLVSPVVTKVARAVDTESSCSLTVIPGSDADLDDANVVVDLYKVADVVADSTYDTYSFQAVSDFEGLQTMLSRMDELDNTRYQLLANEAAKIALALGDEYSSRNPLNPAYDSKEVSPVSGETTNPFTVNPGLYLVIARGSQYNYTKVSDYAVYGTEENADAVITKANSELWDYTYMPELVSLPNTAEVIQPDADGNRQTYKTSDGDWKREITIYLKPSRTERFGDLWIIKDLKTYETRQPATFVYKVTATLHDKVVYSNAVTLVCTAAGKSEPVKIEGKIPSGSTVTIEEVYTGANYSFNSKSPSEDVVISAADIQKVTFTNDYGGGDNGGGSIENKYTALSGETGVYWSDADQIYDEGVDVNPNVTTETSEETTE